jgi:hypothetical protein
MPQLTVTQIRERVALMGLFLYALFAIGVRVDNAEAKKLKLCCFSFSE